VVNEHIDGFEELKGSEPDPKTLKGTKSTNSIFNNEFLSYKKDNNSL
jgi:hypothetical protein